MRPTDLAYFVVDAFTSTPFTGNPAAVVPLDRCPTR
jgi:predicted PhzF superfamily epimerase YddE/YHI9